MSRRRSSRASLILTTTRAEVTLRAVLFRAAWRWFSSALLLTVLHSPAARAERELWQSPPNCPAPEGLKRSADTKAPARAWVVVTESAAGWSATIDAEYEGGKGRRTLTAASCEEIRRAALIALSLVDPAAVTRVESGASSEATAPVTAVVPPAGAESAPPALAPSAATPGALTQSGTARSAAPSMGSSAPSAASDVTAVGSTPNQNPPQRDPESSVPRRRVGASERSPRASTPSANGQHGAPSNGRSSVTASPASRRFSTAFGVLAAFHGIELPMAGGMLDFAVHTGAWRGRIELGLRTTLRARTTEDDLKVNLLLGGLRVEGCRAWQPGALELSFCAGGLLQRLQGSAPALDAGEIAAVWLPGAGAGARVRWTTRGRVSLWAAADLELRYHLVNYTVDERGRIGSFDRVNAVLRAGPEIAF